MFPRSTRDHVVLLRDLVTRDHVVLLRDLITRDHVVLLRGLVKFSICLFCAVPMLKSVCHSVA
jgi:hypothetical protein